jgi:hypothetical protein
MDFSATVRLADDDCGIMSELGLAEIEKSGTVDVEVLVEEDV